MREPIQEDLTIEELVKQATKIQNVSLWGTKLRFHPKLCSTIVGDGNQLVYFQTLDQRPRYWLIRIDSKTDIQVDDFEWECLQDAIVESFGDSESCNARYPVLFNNHCGCSWGKITNRDNNEANGN